MNTDTKAVARYEYVGRWVGQHPTGNYVLFTDHERVVGELTSNVHELERLCDATYVAQGADAYNHACDLIEQLQAERIGKGRDPGTEGSLCDGLTWAYGELLESEDECEAISTALASSRAEVEGLKKLLPEVRICVEYAIDYGSPARRSERKELVNTIDAAMENGNV